MSAVRSTASLQPTSATDAFVSPPQLSPELSLLVAQIFQALGDPTRARLVYALTRAEHSVNELALVAGVSASAISHHLKSLRELRIVKFRREGNRVFYSVDDTHVAALFQEALHHLAHVVYHLPDHPELPSAGM